MLCLNLILIRRLNYERITFDRQLSHLINGVVRWIEMFAAEIFIMICVCVAENIKIMFYTFQTKENCSHRDRDSKKKQQNHQTLCRTLPMSERLSTHLSSVFFLMGWEIVIKHLNKQTRHTKKTSLLFSSFISNKTIKHNFFMLLQIPADDYNSITRCAIVFDNKRHNCLMCDSVAFWQVSIDTFYRFQNSPFNR